MLKEYILLVVLSVGFFSNGRSQDEAQQLYFSDNFRIHPGDVSQTEVFIVKSPLDENLLFASCNTLTFIPFFVSEGIYVSKDGGHSWSGSDSCTGEPIDFHGGDPGITIDANGTFILARLGRSPFTGLYSHYSDDQGVSWSEQVPISTDDLERAAVATDALVPSLFNGRSYALWVKLASPFPVMFSFTDDGAKNWSSPVAINAPESRSAGGDILVGPDGVIYACWAGVTSVSPFREKQVGFASSADGGSTWNVQENAYEMNGITGLLSEKQNIRVNGLPRIAVDMTQGPRRGFIYIVTGEAGLLPAGPDPDIILHRSVDGGVSWSDGIRVNQDLTGNGKTQYFPAIHVDAFGAVNILFYDDRNTTSDSTGVYLARSIDGGDTWIEYEVSDQNFQPVPIGGLGQGYQGDNIDLTSTSTHLCPVWMDNRTGTYQVWTSPIDFSSLNDLNEYTSLHKLITLEPNYPNPFTSHTRLGFNIERGGEVMISLFSADGTRLASLFEGFLPKGKHQVMLDAQDLPLPAGIYYYIVKTGQDQVLGKMILSH